MATTAAGTAIIASEAGLITMGPIQVFHGSKTRLVSLRPWFHVGTQAAALQRMGGHGFLHEYTLSAEDKKVMDVDDWGGTKGTDLLNVLGNTQSAVFHKEFFVGARQLISHIRNNYEHRDKLDEPRLFLESELQSFVMGELVSRGIYILRYRNHVEDRNSDSYFILYEPKCFLKEIGVRQV